MHGRVTSEADPIVHDVLRSSGQPLGAATRASMEASFGYDFSAIRIHADPNAGRAAQSVGAHAFALGSDIVFAPGRYQPETRAGRLLLAHELTHAVQQGTSRQPADAPIRLGRVDDSTEREAESNAARLVGDPGSEPRRQVSAAGGAMLRRAADKGNQPQEAQADACAGWERDPESFTVHVANHFARTRLPADKQGLVRTVKCERARSCTATLETGVQIDVTRLDNGRVDALESQSRQWCRYKYTCDPAGQLVLTLIRCVDILDVRDDFPEAEAQKARSGASPSAPR